MHTRPMAIQPNLPMGICVSFLCVALAAPAAQAHKPRALPAPLVTEAGAAEPTASGERVRPDFADAPKAVASAMQALTPDAPSAAPNLPMCTEVVAWQGALPQTPDEQVRYAVAVDGLNVGTVDFQIARTGAFAGVPAVEYRSLFKLDHLLAAMADIEGRAAALVPLNAASPTTAMSHYTMGGASWHEELRFADAGRRMAVRTEVTPPQAGAARPARPAPKMAQPIVDFVTGFYLVRRLPAHLPACLTVYGNQHHYIVWTTPQGSERIKTPIGVRPADVFEVQYRRTDGDAIGSGRIWLSQTAERLPYRIAFGSDRRIEAHLHTYSMGDRQ